jgi:hypothetical protein
MFRLVSLVGIVALTAAAAALASAASPAPKRLPPDNDNPEESVQRITAAAGQCEPTFHARFSVN